MIRPLEPILAEELMAYVARRPSAGSPLGGTALAKPKVILAHGLCRYTGDPLGESTDLTAVQRIGYRAFVRLGTNSIVAVDCVSTGETKSYRMHFGAIATSWLHQVRLLRRRKQLAGVRGELRSLLVPAHHLMFFWLAFPPEDGKADLFLQTREAAGAPGHQRLLVTSDVESLIQKAVSRYSEMDARRTKSLVNSEDAG
jgi:hypothetical protein